MRHMIDGFQIFPGEHCGSVAMRGLLAHYSGLELPEDVVFGLGAGVDCMVMPMPGLGPVAFGRTSTMELDLAAALGVAYEEATEADNDRAWQQVRSEVLAGRPTMLSGDIFYLDYREYKVHFPGHRFILLGFDDEAAEVYIADRVRDEPETCSLAALMESRNPSEGLSTQNLWGRFGDGTVEHDLVEASRLALERCTNRMLGEDQPKATSPLDRPDTTSGLAGIHRLAAEIPGWAEAEGGRALASFNASAIEKFGNGGGNFRRLYAGFLDWAHRQDPDRVPREAASLATEAADGWTALAGLLWKASDGEDPWAEASALATVIAERETALFERLAEGQARTV